MFGCEAGLLLRPAPLGHIALDLPCELDIVHDVNVDRQIQLRARLLVVDGVQALENHDLVGLDELRWVLVAGVMVVDGLVDRLPLLQGLDLNTHESEVVLPGIQGSEASGLANKLQQARLSAELAIKSSRPSV